MASSPGGPTRKIDSAGIANINLKVSQGSSQAGVGRRSTPHKDLCIPVSHHEHSLTETSAVVMCL